MTDETATQERPTLADELERLALDQSVPMAAALAMGHASVLLRQRQSRTDALEALLREAHPWCPRLPTHPPTGKTQAQGDGWVDLGNRIAAALKEGS